MKRRKPEERNADREGRFLLLYRVGSGTILINTPSDNLGQPLRGIRSREGWKHCNRTVLSFIPVLTKGKNRNYSI